MTKPNEPKAIKVSGRSLETVADRTAREIASLFLSENPETVIKGVLLVTGNPPDTSGGSLPHEVQIYLNAFADGIKMVLIKMMSGQLDLCMLKKEVDHD